VDGGDGSADAGVGALYARARQSGGVGGHARRWWRPPGSRHAREVLAANRASEGEEVRLARPG